MEKGVWQSGKPQSGGPGAWPRPPRPSLGPCRAEACPQRARLFRDTSSGTSLSLAVLPSSAQPTGHLERIPDKTSPSGGDGLAVPQLTLILQPQVRPEHPGLHQALVVFTKVSSLPTLSSEAASRRASRETGTERLPVLREGRSVRSSRLFADEPRSESAAVNAVSVDQSDRSPMPCRGRKKPGRALVLPLCMSHGWEVRQGLRAQ